MNKSILSILFLGLALSGARAHAQSAASATSRISSEIGTQKFLTATLTCDFSNMSGATGGNIGTPNQLLCAMKALNITGATGAAGVTKTVALGALGTLNMHYVVTSPGPTIDGVTYAYEMKVWTCGSGCTATTSYLASVYVAFNANASGSVNQGVLINNFSADSGTLKGSAFMKWDVGTATATKFFRLNMVDCSSSPTGANYVYYTKVGTVATLNEMYSNSPGVVSRTALAWDSSANTGSWQQDSIVSAGGDSPGWLGSFTRVASASDYTYTGVATTGSYTFGAYPTQLSGTTLSGATNQGASCSLNGTNGVPAITSGAAVLTTPLTSAMNGMTLNPPNI